MKEKTKVGKLLEKIGKAVPTVLEIGADLTGIDALNKAAELISGDKRLSAEDKEIFIAQLNAAIQLEQMEIEREKARLADIGKARDIQIAALNQSDVFSKRFVPYLSILWSTASIVFIFTLLFVEIPENNIRLVDTILGFLLGTVIAGIITYYFGSSNGSDKKTDLLNSIREKVGG